jgi:CotH kinase protein/Chitobiase/beta-hexosaminidase C-terminal domain/Lamin Tail Domain/Secretion system C-terminal sorting domain/SprB repeat
MFKYQPKASNPARFAAGGLLLIWLFHRNQFIMIRKLTILFTLMTFCHPIFAQVVINEFSAANYQNITDNFGDNNSDWIELYNNGSAPVNLSGYFLSDDEDELNKYQIPAGVTIAANGFLRIWASGRDQYIPPNIHTNFNINQTDEEWVILSNPSLNILDAFEILIPNQKNHSWARTTNGTGAWAVASGPTPNGSNGTTFTGYVTKPAISPLAGFYPGPTQVSISTPDPGTSIYYTTDGSEPTNFSTQYTGPFTVSATTVVKAIAYSSNAAYLKSHVNYNTYFINETHTIPVMSIAGNTIETLMNGSQIEPEGSFELFNKNGNRVADGTGEFNKHGNDSWAYPQRGIDYICRDQFGDDFAIKYQIFDEEITERDQFQRIILKAAANDNYPFQGGSAHIRDAYVHTLSQKAGMEMDERTNRSAILYVNGEYWGVYEIREKVDDHDYTKYYFNQDKEEIDFIKTWGGTWAEYGVIDQWNLFKQFVLSNDMTDDANYAYVESQLEVLSLIDYMILHAHIVSMDWLNWNTAWWRGYNPEGGAKKWRYILWDEDATFGHYVNYTGVPETGPLADPCNPELLNDPGGQGHIPILNALLQNEDFFALYINRYADLNNQYFNCDFMISLLNQMIGEITPEMPRHITRWGGTMTEWQANVQELRDFIEDRCVVINNAIVDCYEDEGLTGPFNVTILVEPVGGGFVQANTTIGNNYPWNTVYFGGIDVSFTNVPEEDWLFSHWEVLNNPYTPNQFAGTIGMTVTASDTIIAHYLPGPCLGIWVDPELPEEAILCEDGTLTLTAASGPGYTYEWSTGATTQSITVDDNGDYGVTVYNAAGCDGYVEIEVDEEDALEPEIDGYPTFCTGLFTTLDASSGYETYQWSNGATTQTIDVSTPGTYQVEVTSGNCTGITEMEITEISGLDVEITGSLTTCVGTPTQLNAGPNFAEYQWSNGNTTQTTNVSTGGTYFVTVSDPTGCTGTDQVTVMANNTSASASNAQICYGATFQGNTYTQSALVPTTYEAANGCDSVHTVNLTVLPAIQINFNAVDDCTSGGATLTALPFGGLGAPYTYNWESGQTTQVLTLLPEGTYTVTVTDNFGCTNSAAIFIDPAEGITWDFDVDQVSCFGDNDGEIDLTVITAEEPYTLTWSNGSTEEDQDDLSAGNYTVTITDANGCNFGTTLFVGQPNPLLGIINVTPVSAIDEEDGMMSITPTGGTGPYTYQWSTGHQTAIVTDMEAGEFSVTITDANDCEYETTVVIGVYSAIEEIEGLLHFSIQPNPSSATFDVLLSFVQNRELTVAIYDMSGKQIKSYGPLSGQQVTQAVDIREVADGSYLVVVTVEGGKRLEKKIIVAR